MPAPKSELDELGTLIRNAREGLGLNQKLLGERLGFGQSYMSALEAGVVQPDAVLMTKISRLLGLSLVEVVHAATLRGERAKVRPDSERSGVAVDERGLDVVESIDFTDRKFSLPDPESPPDSSAA